MNQDAGTTAGQEDRKCRGRPRWLRLYSGFGASAPGTEELESLGPDRESSASERVRLLYAHTLGVGLAAALASSSCRLTVVRAATVRGAT